MEKLVELLRTLLKESHCRHTRAHLEIVRTSQSSIDPIIWRCISVGNWTICFFAERESFAEGLVIRLFIHAYWNASSAIVER